MSGYSQKRIVVVDDDSANHELVRILLNQNVECLHLRSRPNVGDHHSGGALYDADLGYVGGVTAAVKLLRTLSVDAVLAGSDHGVFFASRLSSELGLKFVWPVHKGDE